MAMMMGSLSGIISIKAVTGGSDGGAEQWTVMMALAVPFGVDTDKWTAVDREKQTGGGRR